MAKKKGKSKKPAMKSDKGKKSSKSDSNAVAEPTPTDVRQAAAVVADMQKKLGGLQGLVDAAQSLGEVHEILGVAVAYGQEVEQYRGLVATVHQYVLNKASGVAPSDRRKFGPSKFINRQSGVTVLNDLVALISEGANDADRRKLAEFKHGAKVYRSVTDAQIMAAAKDKAKYVDLLDSTMYLHEGEDKPVRTFATDFIAVTVSKKQRDIEASEKRAASFGELAAVLHRAREALDAYKSPGHLYEGPAMPPKNTAGGKN